MLELLDLRDMRVAVDDRLATWERRDEARLAPGERARVVHHPDPRAA